MENPLYPLFCGGPGILDYFTTAIARQLPADTDNMFTVAPQADLNVIDDSVMDKDAWILLRRLYPDFLVLLQSIGHNFPAECRLVLELKVLAIVGFPEGQTLKTMKPQECTFFGFIVLHSTLDPRYLLTASMLCD